jgi:hypothetical protein
LPRQLRCRNSRCSIRPMNNETPHAYAGGTLEKTISHPRGHFIDEIWPRNGLGGECQQFKEKQLLGLFQTRSCRVPA